MQQRGGGSGLGPNAEFVPANLAVDFKRPDRFKTDIDEAAVDAGEGVSGPKRPRAAGAAAAAAEVVTQRTVQVGEVPVERVISVGGENVAAAGGGGSAAIAAAVAAGNPDSATDDLVLTKFKQHFHRK